MKNNKLFPWLLGISCLTLITQARLASAATYTVLNTDDDGAGSLRQAITDANANDGLDTIDFDDAVGGETITLASALPTLTEEAIIDGTTLTDVQTGPDITIVGAPAAFSVLQFFNMDAGNVVRGVALSGSNYCLYTTGTTGFVIGGSNAGDGNWMDGCSSHGIQLEYDTDTSILGNIIGGTAGNLGRGINAIGSVNLVVGGTDADEKNVIANNGGEGLGVTSVDGMPVLGNWIGTEDGTTDAGNGGWGIFVDGTSSDVTIGGTTSAARNIISGNNAGGVIIWTSTATGMVVTGNYIGTNAAGTGAIANGAGFVTNSPVTLGGTAAGAGNLISGNASTAVAIQDAGATLLAANVTGSTIQGNKIGTNAAGTAAVTNGGHGIVIVNSNNTIGGTTSTARNIVSGNAWDGIVMQGNWAVTEDNIVRGNYIGTNAAGTAAVANGGSGITMALDATNNSIGGTAAGAGNLISGNALRGIFLGETNSGNIIEGNIIGLNAAGDAILGNGWSGVEMQTDDNMIGGTTTASRNLISGNGGGITLAGDATGNTVINNYIGTDAAGTGAFGNLVDGIFITGTSSDNIIGTATAGNIIVDNGRFGIYIEQLTNENQTVQGNYVGVDSTGAVALGNVGGGMATAGTTIIGGSGTGEGNVISGNSQYGLYVGGTGGSTILGNKIGTNAAGTAAVANATTGLTLATSDNTVGGTTTGARNIISGNTGTGLFILGSSTAEDNTVTGNYIGTNAAGTAAVANGGQGVHISGALATHNTIGGSATGTGNVISGNTERGIFIDGDSDGNTVAGNYIGLNAAGTGALANTLQGVDLVSDNNTVGGTTSESRNVISGNTQQGVLIRSTATGNIIEKNYIGTNAAGTAGIGNGNYGVHVIELAVANFIGVAGHGNVIADNDASGIRIEQSTADNNSIQANIIGLAADGSTALGNTGGGIVLSEVDGTQIGTINTPSARNIIASNTTYGIQLAATTHTTIVNNYVGLASNGTTERTNGAAGIRVESSSATNTVGGTATGAGNTIATADNESCTAIIADAGNFNAIRGNSCVNETATEFNITRGGSSNENVATPTITGASTTTSLIVGTAIANGAVDVFGNGLYLTSTTANGSGAWSVPYSTASGTNISASATNSTNSTSATVTPQVTVTDDVANPTVSALNPADDATGVSTTANLVVTFNEAVVIGSGNILIKKTVDNSTVETISVSDGSKVTGSGTAIITINPSSTLGALVGYYVQLEATTFDDLSGNSYAGIADTTSWNFITAGTAGVTASSISANTTELGGTATFTVQLNTEPTADVTIPISSSDTTEGTVSPSSLTFSNANWATPQTVIVTGVNDDVDDGDVAYSAVLGSATSADSNYSGLNPADVFVTNSDNDTTNVTVSTITGNTTEAGGTATFTVRLNSQPTTDVMIALSSSDTTEGTVSPSSLTFTTSNWSTTQTATVTGVHDNVDDGDVAYSIVLSAISSSDGTYNTFNPNDVSVTTTDDDTSGVTVSALSGQPTDEGGVATFMVGLDSEPTANVTIPISSANTAEGTVSSSSLTFTKEDWGNQTVVVTGVADNVDDNNAAYTVVVGVSSSADSLYNAIDPADVSVTNVDGGSGRTETLVHVDYVTGTSRGAGIIRTYDANDSKLAQWTAFSSDGVVPQLTTINGIQYVFAAQKRGGNIIRVYSTSGELLASKKLSKASIVIKQFVLGNLDDHRSNLEIAVASQLNSAVYVNILRFNPVTNTLSVLKTHKVSPVKTTYHLLIENKKVIIMLDGEKLYSTKAN